MDKLGGDTVSQLVASIADLIKHAITILGVPGFVLSIVLVVVIGLLIGFRWKVLHPTLQFVLILLVVLMVFGLAAVVVLQEPPRQVVVSPPPASTPSGHPGLLSISGQATRDYFKANFGEPIRSFNNELDGFWLEGDWEANAKLFQKGLLKDRLIAQAHTTNDFWFGLVGMLTKSKAWEGIGYGVVFKSRQIPEYYQVDLDRAFGTGIRTLSPVALMKRAEELVLRFRAENAGLKQTATLEEVRSHLKNVKSGAPPKIVYIAINRSIVAVRNQNDQPPNLYGMPQTVIFFSLLNEVNEGPSCKIETQPEGYEFYSLKEIEGCKLQIGPAIGFAKLFPGTIKAGKDDIRLSLSKALLGVFNMLEVAGYF